MSNDYDIFISYATVSNELPQPFTGWVTMFHKALRDLLKSDLGGEEPNIYFDRHIAEPNQAHAEILQACKSSCLFLAITTPAYHRRDWTRQELDVFTTAYPDYSNRLFIAELQPTEEASQLPILHARHKTTFHQKQTSESRATIPLPIGGEHFYGRLVDLAAAILKQLTALPQTTLVKSTNRISAPLGTTLSSAAPMQRPVLLAQVTDDLEEERIAVRRYLEDYEIPVLPSQDYPQGGQEFETAFAADLKKCHLVVQLLGALPSRTPPDLKIGYARHQALATRNADVELIQWCRSDVKVNEIKDAAQKELLSSDRIVSSTLEELKKSIVDFYRKPKTHKRDDKNFFVFVIAEKADHSTAKKIKNTLKPDYMVGVPLEGKDGSIQEDLNANLRDCDALVLVYGNAAPNWIGAQMRNMRKIRPTNPIAHGAICCGPPPLKPDVNLSMPTFSELDCKTADGTDWEMTPLCNWLKEIKE